MNSRTRPEFAKRMKHRVQHATLASRDDHGMRSFNDPVERIALIEPYQQLVMTRDGGEKPCRSRIFVGHPTAGGTVTPIDPEDRLTLPDGSTPPILGSYVRPDPGDTTPHHCTVYI